MTDKPKETWTYNPSPLLESPRKVSGVFHKAVVDKDGEMITPDAIRESIPDYMHLPALHDFHKERPVGLATKVWENSDGSFGFEGVIKATEDCDDVWEKIKKGNYDHVSIFGKREQGNNNCSLPTPLRSGACITTGVRLDSISVCDGNARNDSTSLEVRKGMRMVFDADELKKADVEKGHTQTNREGAYRAFHKEQRETGGKERYNNLPETSKEKVHRADVRPKFTKAKKAEIEETPPMSDGEREAWKNKLMFADKKTRDKIYNAFPDINAKKAETTDGELQHASTDYAKEKKCGTKCKRKITVEKADDIDNEDRMEQRGTKTGSTTKEKGAYLPHRETGSEHPKRSKEGYPLKTGGDTAPASHHPAGDKGTAPPVENFTERNARVEILRERIADKAKDTTAESARKQDDSAKPKRGTIGRSIGVKKAEDMDVEKGEERIPPAEEKTPTKTRRAKEGDKKATWAKKPAFDKADTEDEENWQKEAFDKLEEEEPGRAADYRQHERGGEKGKRQYFKKGEEDTEEKAFKTSKWGKDTPKKDVQAVREYNKENAKHGNFGQEKRDVEAGMRKLTGDNMRKGDDEDDDTMTEPVKKSKKAKLEPEEPEKFEEPEEEEEDEDESLEEEEDESEEKPPKKVEKAEEEVEKGELDRTPLSSGKSSHQYAKESLSGSAKNSQDWGAKVRSSRKTMRDTPHTAAADKRSGAEGLKLMKGETMEEEYEEQEFITKAMVPIEEIDTIVKARTEEISKAYIAQFDEIKKAYDAKFLELTSKVEKMENETIRKGGQIVVIPQLMGMDGSSSMSNADALAKMQAGR